MGSRKAARNLTLKAARVATTLQGGVVQALPSAPPGQQQRGGGVRSVQVPGAPVRLREQEERALQAAHGERQWF